MARYDFGTLQVFEKGEYLEMHCPFGDPISKGVVKDMRAFWDKVRKCYKIQMRNRTADELTSQIRAKFLARVPAGWAEIAERLSGARCTTTRYVLVIGLGGVRIYLPPGHRHHYTLKAMNALESKLTYFIPADAMGGTKTHSMIQDIFNDDAALFAKSVEYLHGFSIKGKMKLEVDDPLMMELMVGATIVISPSIPSLMDSKLPTEPIHALPVTVAAAVGDMDEIDVKLDFLDAKAATAAAMAYEAGGRVRPMMDRHHMRGQWRRTRR